MSSWEVMSTDTGFFGPDSLTWRLHADPIMGIAGLRALFFQALHPVAMAGVAQNSTFRDDPWGRLERTADYVGITSYGTVKEARRIGARVRGVHRKYSGRDVVTGRSYRVDDPDLLLWVHVSLVDSFLSVVRRSGMRLTEGDADSYLTEQVRVAELVGLDRADVPATTAELTAYLEGVRPTLVASPHAWDAARFVMAPPMPTFVSLATPARPAWASLAGLSLSALPPWARRLYRLPVLPGSELATTAALRGLRASLMAIPEGVREGPHLKAGRRRLTKVATS